MKKVLKFKSALTGKVITVTINKKLNKVKPSPLILEKLEEVNKALRNLKSPLPKQSTSSLKPQNKLKK